MRSKPGGPDLARRRHRIALVVVAAVASALVSIQRPAPAVAAPAIGTIVELADNPAGASSLSDVTLGVDGNLWLATQSATRGLARMTPAGVVTDFPVTGAPRRVALGPDQNIWYASGGGIIGRVTPSGVDTHFTVPGDIGDIKDIARGPDGNVWFTAPSSGWIGRITLAGTITLFDLSPLGPTQVNGITSGPDGNLWVADRSGAVVRVTPAGGLTRFTSGIAAGSQPYDIAAAPDGNLWFTEAAGNRLARITTLGVVTEFATGISPGAWPFQIAEGPDGNVWFTEFDGSRVGRVKLDGTITEFSTGITSGSQPYGIAAGPGGTVWFTEGARKYAGRIQAVTDPGAPVIGPAIAGNGQVTVNWSPPADYGGGPIYSYTITPFVGSTPQTPKVFNSSDTSQVITGLANGTTYTFKVAATNAAATGPNSAASNAVTPATVPGVPAMGSVSGASGVAHLAWSPPASNGGLALSGYRVIPSVSGIAQASKDVGVVNSTTVVGLTNGVAYRFKVAARNPAGIGNQSAASGLVIPPFSSPSSFVAQQTNDFLGRPPTTGESAAGLSLLNGGAKPGAYISQLRDGDDAVQNVDPLVRLYFAYFLRTPDRGGLDFWLRRRRNNVRLYEVSDQFARSSEFKNRYGSLTNLQFVKLVYQNVLGRPGDAAGIASWTGKLDAKSKTRGEVMVGFSESSEYQNLIAPAVDASVVWLSLLGSRPDAASFTYWVDALTAAPTTDADMAASLMADARYAQRLG